MVASAEFRLSITRALADQLVSSLASLDPEPLTIQTIAALPNRAGVYQLYVNGDMVYVGKADPSLPKRLSKHYRKLSSRLNIDIRDVGYVCLFVDEDLHAVAPERLLIHYYKTDGEAPWNFNGFGSNDPGQNRDTTIFEADHFDSQYPADLNWICDDITAGLYMMSDLLKHVKSALPYVFRYQAAAFQKDLHVVVPRDAPTADELFTLLGQTIAQAQPQWQIVALPGYAIMYPKPGPYPSARKTYQ
ncbi:hypothetical protein ABZ260_20275 [Streptosporangium sp. NPDC006013]|uniref:hypothetical protein n=1 Tax=Streptosporangium sp. NPDC006013 TaxID=3155596 RepID=UPI00339DEE8F